VDHDKAQPVNSTDPVLSYAQLLMQLGAMCSARRTGTMFIATADNQSARIGVNHGEIVSLMFRFQRGIDALKQIRRITAGRCNFVDGPVQPPSPDDLPYPADLRALMPDASAVASSGTPAAPVASARSLPVPAVGTRSSAPPTATTRSLATPAPAPRSGAAQSRFGHAPVSSPPTPLSPPTPSRSPSTSPPQPAAEPQSNASGQSQAPRSGQRTQASEARFAMAHAIIEVELTDVVGPIAPLLCRDHIDQAIAAGPPWRLEVLVDAVAREIGDAAKEARFKQRALSRVREL
jgi:hypothetical protein